jgi:AcrR family transcriptional regulator
VVRTVDIEAHAERREAFIDAAQRLMQTKGYEQMSVQDVLGETNSSRGAFYHYFPSKTALLEAVVERIADRALAAAAPLVAEPGLDAVAKMEAVFRVITRWKLERTELMRAVLRVWDSDDNALLREKTRRATIAGLTPLLAAVIRQGVDEGVFTVSFPEEAARVLVAAMAGAREGAVHLFLDEAPGPETRAAVERLMVANEEAFERVLGVAPGSLAVFDRQALEEWYA